MNRSTSNSSTLSTAQTGVCPRFGSKCKFGAECRHPAKRNKKGGRKPKINPPKRAKTVPFQEINESLESMSPSDWIRELEGEGSLITSKTCRDLFDLNIDWSGVAVTATTSDGVEISIGEEESAKGSFRRSLWSAMVRSGLMKTMISEKFPELVGEDPSSFEMQGIEFLQGLIPVSNKDVADILNDTYEYPEDYEDGWFLGIVEGIPGVKDCNSRELKSGKKVYTSAYWFPRWPTQKYILSLFYHLTTTRAFTIGVPDQ